MVMMMMEAEDEDLVTSGPHTSLHFSISILTISAGALLLLVNDYASSPDKAFIPDTALGIELLIIAALLAYSGVYTSEPSNSLYTTLCLTISALWCGSGLVHILAGEGLMGQGSGLRDALVPGLAAFALALSVMCGVAAAQGRVEPCLVSLAVGLACAHEIAGLVEFTFGQSATAACYLLVCCVGAYFGGGRLLRQVTGGRVGPPGTRPAGRGGPTGPGRDSNGAVAVGLVMNLVSASVLACPVLGVVPGLSVGHVPWLWTAGVFQLGVCVLCFRATDILAATFFGFTSILKFAEGYSALVRDLTNQAPFSPAPFPTVLAVLFFILALFSCLRSLLDGLYPLFFVAYCIAIAAQPGGFFQGGTQGVQAAIFVASALMILVTLYNQGSRKKIPTGEGLLKSLLARSDRFTPRTEDKDRHAPYLGYSKYADAEALGHGCSMLAAFSITASVVGQDPLSVLILPWAVVSGGVLQSLCGLVGFARGKTLESTAFVYYGAMWTVWGVTRFGGLLDAHVRGFQVAVGIVGFMLFNLLVACGTLLLSAAWCVHALCFQLVLLSFLLDAVDALPRGYDIGVGIVFGLVSFYFFLASLLRCTFETPRLPLGGPLIKLPGLGGGRERCPHLQARKTSSVGQIAEIMKNGGICGMPTDTVYVLVAACNRPDAVEKAYKVKKQAQERPMSIWISSIKQLEQVRHQINPLLWDFMEVAWPSSISLVIPRAPWMDFFDLNESSKYIGTPQSIAIRNPDCTVANHLISQVGPIAVTSANPTGEADTTHHNQVYAKLGYKVDGVLCDGPSPENIASTVVDCTKIESGQIGFYRVGLIPKSKVLGLFEEVQKRHRHGRLNAGFETDITDSPTEPVQSRTEPSDSDADSGLSQPTPAESLRSLDLSTHADEDDEEDDGES